MKRILLFLAIMLGVACTRMGTVTDLSTLKVGDRTQIAGTLTALTQRGFILADEVGNNAYVYVGPDFDPGYFTIGCHVEVKADVTSYRGILELQNAEVDIIGDQEQKYVFR